jgi:hypothetical protein
MARKPADSSTTQPKIGLRLKLTWPSSPNATHLTLDMKRDQANTKRMHIYYNIPAAMIILSHYVENFSKMLILSLVN